jgi:cell division protein FtsL
MKVIIETFINLVKNEDLQKTISRETKVAKEKVKDELVTFVLDTEEIFDIAKSSGLEAANTAIDKVLGKYSEELKGKVSSVINS